jgi:hypothetical protein
VYEHVRALVRAELAGDLHVPRREPGRRQVREG